MWAKQIRLVNLNFNLCGNIISFIENSIAPVRIIIDDESLKLNKLYH